MQGLLLRSSHMVLEEIDRILLSWVFPLVVLPQDCLTFSSHAMDEAGLQTKPELPLTRHPGYSLQFSNPRNPYWASPHIWVSPPRPKRAGKERERERERGRERADCRILRHRHSGSGTCFNFRSRGLSGAYSGT